MICLTAVLICGLPGSADAQSDVTASDLSGRWKDADSNEFVFQSTGSGQVTMQVIGSETRKDMRFRGQFDATGFTISARVTSVSQISSAIPLTVRRQALAQYPNITYRYDVKPVDKNTVELTAYGHSITRNGDTLKSVNLDVDKKTYKLARLPNVPNLRIVAFTNERKGTGDAGYWLIRATVENNGDGDLGKDFLIRVWYADTDTSPHPGRPWRKVSYTASLRPPLRKGR